MDASLVFLDTKNLHVVVPEEGCNCSPPLLSILQVRIEIGGERNIWGKGKVWEDVWLG